MCMHVKFAATQTLPPVGKQKRYSPQLLTYIQALKINPPANRPPIDWKLVTNLPVGDFAIAIEKLEWYVLRWQAEVFHKVMKSGCRAGDARLETAEWLAKFLALIAMVSWCILFLTMSAPAKSEVALRSITFGSKRSGPQMRILSCFGWVGSSMASETFRIARHAANIFWRTAADGVEQERQTIQRRVVEPLFQFDDVVPAGPEVRGPKSS